jgi:hypothetical protein
MCIKDMYIKNMCSDAKAKEGASMVLVRGCLWVQVVGMLSSNLLRQHPTLSISVHVASQWTQAIITGLMSHTVVEGPIF